MKDVKICKTFLVTSRKQLRHNNKFFSSEHKGDLLYDLNVRQKTFLNGNVTFSDHAIEKQLSSLDKNSALIVVDWPMKFLQLRHREKQSDWYGKRGISWHVSSGITKNSEISQLEVSTYAYIS